MTTRRAFASFLASGVIGLALALPSLSRRPALPERPPTPVFGWKNFSSPLEFAEQILGMPGGEKWYTDEQKAIWDAVASGKRVRLGHQVLRVRTF